MDVRVPALGGIFQGKVARFSFDVKADTRTMHTEVDVPNPKGQLIPGMYAEAVLALDQNAKALVVPVQAVDHSSSKSDRFRGE